MTASWASSDCVSNIAIFTHHEAFTYALMLVGYSLSYCVGAGALANFATLGVTLDPVSVKYIVADRANS